MGKTKRGQPNKHTGHESKPRILHPKGHYIPPFPEPCDDEYDDIYRSFTSQRRINPPVGPISNSSFDGNVVIHNDNQRKRLKRKLRKINELILCRDSENRLLANEEQALVGRKTEIEGLLGR